MNSTAIEGVSRCLIKSDDTKIITSTWTRHTAQRRSKIVGVKPQRVTPQEHPLQACLIICRTPAARRTTFNNKKHNRDGGSPLQRPQRTTIYTTRDAAAGYRYIGRGIQTHARPPISACSRSFPRPLSPSTATPPPARPRHDLSPQTPGAS